MKKPYAIYTPVDNTLFNRYKKDYLYMFGKVGCKGVLLSLGDYALDEANRKRIFDEERENIEVLRANGFLVGVWLWTFMVSAKNAFRKIVSIEGNVSEAECCPSDEAFVDFSCGYVEDIAKLSPDLILFDDDFRYGFLDCGLGCLCDGHVDYIRALVGEEIGREELGKAIASGGKNKYRSAYLEANRRFFAEFAKKIRRTVDAVNDKIRIGICACMDVWDFTGISAYELSLILAGGTKPYLRLIGAPYWAANKGWGNRIQDVIDLERMERNWCGDEAEIVAECDPYPRTRYRVPSSYSELFDLNLRFDGSLDGIQKYLFDYTAGPYYERGYFDAHMHSADLRDKIGAITDGKRSVGISVLESMRKFENAVIPKEVEFGSGVQDMFFSPASRMLSANGFPSVYNEYGDVCVVFGENAAYADPKKLKCAVIDLRAAQILTERGEDVGLKTVGETAKNTGEYYADYDCRVESSGVTATKCELDEKAIVKSRFDLNDGTDCPSSYLYENANGRKYLVFTFNAYFNNEIWYRNYCRQRQLADTVRGFFNAAIPAYATGNADVYVQCKTDGKNLAVAVSNCSCDHLYDVKIYLSERYGSAEGVGFDCGLDGDCVTIGYMPPLSFGIVKLGK